MEYKQGDRVYLDGAYGYRGYATVVALEELMGILSYLVIRDDGRGWEDNYALTKHADFLQGKNVRFWAIPPSCTMEIIPPDKDPLKGENS
jgi:hypothetical protein